MLDRSLPGPGFGPVAGDRSRRSRSPPTPRGSTRLPPTPPPSRCASPTASAGSTTILRLGISFPAAFRAPTSTTTGTSASPTRDFLFYTLGADMQLGPWALGVLADFQSYDLLARAEIGRSAGHRDVGAPPRGARPVVLRAVSSRSARACAPSRCPSTRHTEGSSTNQVSMEGDGPEVGVLIRPDYEPWRHRRHVSRARGRKRERRLGRRR